MNAYICKHVLITYQARISLAQLRAKHVKAICFFLKEKNVLNYANPCRNWTFQLVTSIGLSNFNNGVKRIYYLS